MSCEVAGCWHCRTMSTRGLLPEWAMVSLPGIASTKRRVRGSPRP